jgi:hypothetical protein
MSIQSIESPFIVQSGLKETSQDGRRRDDDDHFVNFLTDDFFHDSQPPGLDEVQLSALLTFLRVRGSQVTIRG